MLLAIMTLACLANVQVLDPKFYGPIEGWPFAKGGHTGDRTARISGGRESETRSLLTLDKPVTGDVSFEIWLYTGNHPRGNVSSVGGNVGVFTLQFANSGIAGPLDESRKMFDVGNVQFGSPWLHWETGTLDGSPRYCGYFSGDCGVPTIRPDEIEGLSPAVLDRVKGIIPRMMNGEALPLKWTGLSKRSATKPGTCTTSKIVIKTGSRLKQINCF